MGLLSARKFRGNKSMMLINGVAFVDSFELAKIKLEGLVEDDPAESLKFSSQTIFRNALNVVTQEALKYALDKNYKVILCGYGYDPVGLRQATLYAKFYKPKKRAQDCDC